MNKILIANRGEIAVRILRTCREMGIRTVAVYSECDRKALHVQQADEACFIGPDRAEESYLRIDKLIEAAIGTGAGAIHPGYGFLSENPAFAEACEQHGITFVGPSPAAMRVMGSKTGARDIARHADVPVVPGSFTPFGATVAVARMAALADEIGYPLMVKAVAGGGGKGMRVVREPAELAGAVALARSEAASAFGDSAVYFERLLDAPRHIEVQLLGDRHGQIATFVERECSIQRRHQKVIEETPSPAVSHGLRARLTSAAAAIGAAAGYTSAGTIEFLVDRAGAFYFLEMNARLQVEHPITEVITGIDFVRAQIEIARGAPLAEVLRGIDVDPAGFVTSRGHAIEVRVYAEDPDHRFLPSPGRITHLRPASGPGVRDDSGAFEGWDVPTAYDPLISKLIAWAPDRPRAVARMLRALSEYDVRGIRTTIGFCSRLIASREFQSGTFDTGTVDRWLDTRSPARAVQRGDDGSSVAEIAAIAAALWVQERQQTRAGNTSAAAVAGPWVTQGRADALR